MNNNILLPTLSFPLNAYAQALFLHLGELNYLHYGLWDEGVNSLAKAQQKASDLLWQHLPKATEKKRLLEVGIGLGTSAQALIQQGFDYTGITPDNHQIIYAYQRYGRAAHFVNHAFEQHGALAPYDLILFQESAQYIQAETLLSRCKQLLSPTGEVLIMDEIPRVFVNNLDSYLQKAGFSVVTQLDLTAQAAPSISYLCEVIAAEAAAVCRDLNIPMKKLDYLLQSLRQREQAYQNGSYCYQLIRFSQ